MARSGEERGREPPRALFYTRTGKHDEDPPPPFFHKDTVSIGGRVWGEERERDEDLEERVRRL